MSSLNLTNEERVWLSRLLVDQLDQLRTELRPTFLDPDQHHKLQRRLELLTLVASACLKKIWEGTGPELTLASPLWEHLGMLAMCNDSSDLSERIHDLVH
jgi:hypothetical protein